MGQRSQIYIRYNKGAKKGLVANYYGWNYKERMISRARWGIDLIKKWLDKRQFYTSDERITRLSRVFDTNFDMHDYQVSCDIIKEYMEQYPEDNFNESVFLMQHNNDGKLFIDIGESEIKYAFLGCDADINNIMDGEAYMLWENNGEDWRKPTEYFTTEEIKICEENIKVISEKATLMTKEELEDFICYDYGYKVANVSRLKSGVDKAYIEIDNFRDKLGETFYDAFMEDDNTTYEMSKGIISVLENCNTEEEFKAANAMLTAVCGYGIDTLVGRVQERDEQGYVWTAN